MATHSETTKKSLDEIKEGLPSEVREELDLYEKQIRDFRLLQIGEIKMQKIRLQLGTYAQRQPGVQMQRIKIPYGDLNPEKLQRLAEVSDEYADGFMHLTTRQDVQMYFIQLDRIPDMMRELADVGITTREACGNTIRNVTASPFSGASPMDVFDVTPYADAFVNFTLRNPICQNMGRKFKVAFESNEVKDDAGIRIHDLGFRARIRKIDGKMKRGFQVYVGGGLGSSPMLGHLWTEFLPEEEMIPFSAAVVRIFDRYGERKSRMKARMKFLINKLGMDEFRKLVETERAELKMDPSWNDYLRYVKEREESPPEHRHDIPAAPEGIEDDPAYQEWKRSSVVPQSNGGHSMVHVRLQNGDITSAYIRELAKITDLYAEGHIRITIHQNFLLRWVPNEAIPSLYAALREAGLAEAGAETFADITACPGADTCRLGITSAKGLATRLNEGMKNGLGEFTEMARDLKIKISGCPNACAQHVSANIGFQGGAMTKDGRRVPSEMLYVGGALLGDDSRLGEFILKIPTRNAPDAVKKLLQLYRDERQEEEEFDLVMKRLGKDRIKSELEPLTHIPSFEDSPEFYKDWGQEQEKFDILKGVKGECAGATVEEKEPTFDDAEKGIQQAEAHLSHKDYEVSILESYHAIAHAAHVPLYAKLVDPFTPAQTTWQFENLFVRTGEVSSEWMDMHERLEDAIKQEPTEALAVDMMEKAREFYEVCREINIELKGEVA